MIGAIIGDVVGSIYEYNNVKTKDFVMFSNKHRFTDDTVITVAVASALLEFDGIDEILDDTVEDFQKLLVEKMVFYGRKHILAGYGNRFFRWMVKTDHKPYQSFGNGSAMRVSPVAWYATTLDQALWLAEKSAEVTHDHPDGIKGAVATAGAIFLARTGASKQEIRKFVEQYYTIDFTLKDIRSTYKYDTTCQGCIPQAMQAFFESNSFEDAIRNVISIGGDSDTIGAITGSVAEAYYGADQEMKNQALSYLTDDLLEVVNMFEVKFL